MTLTSRGRLAVHGHFYQPLRVDPFSGLVPADPSAAPFHDWNARVDAECYRPNAERGTLSRISYDVGPTLAGWLATEAPASYHGFIAADGAASMSDAGTSEAVTSEAQPAHGNAIAQPAHGNAIAQSFHHTILPLASAADRRTEIRWGLRDFLIRFGRPADGLWFPETAIDLPTLRSAAEEGVRYTILAPWQSTDANLETRRPYRVELGGGRSLIVAFYDAGLSASASFEPSATADADRFARERVATRFGGTPFADGEPGLVVVATDGELYGHHQPFRDLFLQRLVAPAPAVPDRGFDVVSLGATLLEPRAWPMRTTRIAERTSWSCHHGVARWSYECPDAADGRWKGPLRAALERVAGAIDAITGSVFAALPGAPDPWAARDAYVDVVIGIEPPAAFSARWLGDAAPADDRRRFLELLEAQRWRLAMFASDGWFWDDPIRPETKHNLLCAARAVRLVDGVADTRLERSLVADLALFASPGQGLDGAAIYRAGLSEVGQPGPAA